MGKVNIEGGYVYELWLTRWRVWRNLGKRRGLGGQRGEVDVWEVIDDVFSIRERGGWQQSSSFSATPKIAKCPTASWETAFAFFSYMGLDTTWAGSTNSSPFIWEFIDLTRASYWKKAVKGWAKKQIGAAAPMFQHCNTLWCQDFYHYNERAHMHEFIFVNDACVL